jgi:hypothetical protein
MIPGVPEGGECLPWRWIAPDGWRGRRWRLRLSYRCLPARRHPRRRGSGKSCGVHRPTPPARRPHSRCPRAGSLRARRLLRRPLVRGQLGAGSLPAPMMRVRVRVRPRPRSAPPWDATSTPAVRRRAEAAGEWPRGQHPASSPRPGPSARWGGCAAAATSWTSVCAPWCACVTSSIISCLCSPHPPHHPRRGHAGRAAALPPTSASWPLPGLSLTAVATATRVTRPYALRAARPSRGYAGASCVRPPPG